MIGSLLLNLRDSELEAVFFSWNKQQAALEGLMVRNLPLQIRQHRMGGVLLECGEPASSHVSDL